MAAPTSGKDTELRELRRRIRAHPALGAAVVFGILLVLLLWGGQLYQASLEGQARAVTDQHLMVYRNSLENSIDSRILHVQEIAATVEGEVEAEGTPDFPFYLRTAALSYPDIQDISLAPGGMVLYRYPPENGSLAPPEDLIHDSDPGVRSQVERALISNDLVVRNPYTSVDGGERLVVMKAIMNESEVWGLLTVTLDLSPALMESLGPGNSTVLSLAIRDTSGRVFFGDAALFSQSPVIRRVSVHDGFWDFAAIPPGGWAAAAEKQMGAYWTGGVIILLLVTGLVFLGLSSHSMLSRAVQERTRDLEREKGTLKKMNRALKVIGECNSDLVRARTEQELLQRICDILVTSGDYPLAWVGRFVMDGGTARLIPIVASRSPEKPGPDLFTWKEGFIEEEMSAEKAMITTSPQVKKCPVPAPGGTGFNQTCELCHECRSLITMPLSDQKPSSLVLVIYSARTDAFDPEEVALLIQMSEDLTFGITSIRTRTAKEAAEQELLIKGYALNSSVSGISMADLDGRIIYTNDAFLRMFGYTSPSGVLGESIESFSPRDAHDVEMTRTISEAVMKEGSWIGEVRPARRDGTRFDANLLVSVVKDDKGNPIRTMASFIDITDQKEQERQMVIRNNAIASSINPILFFDLSGKVTYANRAFLSTWGYERPEQVVGRNYDEFFSGDESFGKRKLLLESERGWVGELKARKPDGSPLTVQSAASMVFSSDGSPICMMASFLDITAMRQAYERIAYQARLLNEVSEAIVAVNTDFRITSWNKKAESLFGWKAGEVMGERLLDLLQTRCVDQDDDLPPEGENGGVSNLRAVQKRKDGSSLYVDIITMPTKDTDGRVSGSVHVMHDISDRMKVEELKREAFVQIEENFMQMAILNDQIRNPLSVIVGLASLEGGEIEGKILRQAHEIDAIITRLDQGWVESAKVREFLKKHYGSEERRTE